MRQKPDEIVKLYLGEDGKPYISCEYSRLDGRSPAACTCTPNWSAALPGQLHLGLRRSGLVAGLRRRHQQAPGLAAGFEDRPNDYEFSGDGVMFADRTSQAQEVKQLYANVGSVPDESSDPSLTATVVSTASESVYRASAGGRCGALACNYRFDVPAGGDRAWADHLFRRSPIWWRCPAAPGDSGRPACPRATDWAPAGYRLTRPVCRRGFRSNDGMRIALLPAMLMTSMALQRRYCPDFRQCCSPRRRGSMVLQRDGRRRVIRATRLHCTFVR